MSDRSEPAYGEQQADCGRDHGHGPATMLIGWHLPRARSAKRVFRMTGRSASVFRGRSGITIDGAAEQPAHGREPRPAPKRGLRIWASSRYLRITSRNQQRERDGDDEVVPGLQIVVVGKKGGITPSPQQQRRNQADA